MDRAQLKIAREKFNADLRGMKAGWREIADGRRGGGVWIKRGGRLSFGIALLNQF